MLTKRCPWCKEVKFLSAFGRNKAKRDGLAVYCKPCARAHVRAAKGHADHVPGLALMGPHCPRCQKRLAENPVVPGLYRCRNASCAEFDRPMAVRLYVDGMRT